MVEHSSKMDTHHVELERIKKECSVMIKLLKKLEKEENDLRRQNEILAREALVNGFELGLLETPAPKRRKTPSKKSDSML